MNRVLSTAVIVFASLALPLSAEAAIINGGFENGFDSWQTSSDYRVETSAFGNPTQDQGIEAALNQIKADLLNPQGLIEQIAESTPPILYVYDLNQRRNVYANRQLTEVLGYSPATIQAGGTEFVQTLIYPDDKDKVAKIFQQLATARDGEVVESEYRLRNASGEWTWLYIQNVVLTRNADGSPREVLGTATDITQLKQTVPETSSTVGLLFLGTVGAVFMVQRSQKK